MEPTTHPKKAKRRRKPTRSAVSGPARKILEAMIAGRRLTSQRLFPHCFRYWLDGEIPKQDELTGEEWTVEQEEVTLGAVASLVDAGLIAPREYTELERDQFSYYVTPAGKAFKHAPAPEPGQGDLLESAA